MRLIIGLFIAFGIIIYSICSSAKQYSMAFIDLESLILIGGIFIGSFLVLSSFKELKLLGVILTNNPAINNTGKDNALQLCNNLYAMERIMLAAGLAGSLIGFTAMLMTADDPSRMGPAFAFSLLTVLYAGLIAELLIRAFYTISIKRCKLDIMPKNCKLFGMFIAVNLAVFFAEFGIVLTQSLRAS